MINNDWDELLKAEFQKPYFKKVMKFIQNEYKHNIIYPSYENIFNALKYSDYKNTKVVILGQDPYHGVGQAHGLSFSIFEGVPKPPSLRNIFKELKNDLDINLPENGNLESWAHQGVLLLNSVLTVRKGLAASHSGYGWETFTDFIIKKVNEKDTPVVFILWGNYAKKKKELITNPLHFIIESFHPSPFAAYKGFFGSKPFSKTNNFLEKNKIKKIKWEIK